MLCAAGRTAVHIDASQRNQKSDGDHHVREYQHQAPPPPSAVRLPAWEPPRNGAQPPQPRWCGSRQLLPSRSRFILGKPREDREHRDQPGLARAQGVSNSFQGSLLCCWQAQSRTPSARSCANRSYPAPEAQTCDWPAALGTAPITLLMAICPPSLGFAAFLRRTCSLPRRFALNTPVLGQPTRASQRPALGHRRSGAPLTVLFALRSWSLRRSGLVCV